MNDRTGTTNAVSAALNYLAGLPTATQAVLAVTALSAVVLLVAYREYRRRTRTTPTLTHRATSTLARTIRTGWAILRAPAQKEQTANLAENMLVFWFVAVVAGLIMQGLVPFARDDMGLTGPWPYLLFFALDGMAAFFGLVAYRLAKQGARAAGPRLMVLAIMGGSAWFQWAHALDKDLPARVAWAALPLIAGYLWETVLKYRRRAWKKTQPDARRVPRARWLWDPAGSLGITRRTHMWNLNTWEEGLETHMTRAECIRQLRREFGVFWTWKVPADIAIRLKRGFKVSEAAAWVPKVIESHRREIENQRLVKQAKADARAGQVVPGTYTVSVAPAPTVDLSPVPGVADVMAPLTPDEEEDGDTADLWPEETPEVFTPTTPVTDPWKNAPPADTPFIPFEMPNPGPSTGSIIEPAPADDDGFWSTLDAAGEPTTRAQRTTQAPVEHRPAPYDGTGFDEAVDLYLDSVDAAERGERSGPLSGRALCRAMQVDPNNRRWVRSVQAEAKTRLGSS